MALSAFITRIDNEDMVEYFVSLASSNFRYLLLLFGGGMDGEKWDESCVLLGVQEFSKWQMALLDA